MACADIWKLWKLFDKKAAIGELWYLVPGFQKKFSGMFIYNIRINHSDSAAYLVTQLWPKPPVKIIVSPSRIPQAPYPPCSKTKLASVQESQNVLNQMILNTYPRYPRAKPPQRDLPYSAPLLGGPKSWDMLVESRPCERILPPCDRLRYKSQFRLRNKSPVVKVILQKWTSWYRGQSRYFPLQPKRCKCSR